LVPARPSQQKWRGEEEGGQKKRKGERKHGIQAVLLTAAAGAPHGAPPPPPSFFLLIHTCPPFYLRVLIGSKPETADTAPAIKPRTTPPAMTELSRFFRDGVTAACFVVFWLCVCVCVCVYSGGGWV